MWIAYDKDRIFGKLAVTHLRYMTCLESKTR